MSAFDPFAATLEEALAQADADEPQGAVQKFLYAQALCENQEFYEENPLDGIAWCCVAGITPPDWLARSFLQRFRRASQACVPSWDDAFGAPWPKSTQLAAIRRRKLQRVRIANLAAEFERQHPDLPMSALWSLFGPAARRRAGVCDHIVNRARRLGVSRSVAQELYAEAVKAGWAIDRNVRRARQRAQAEPQKWRALDEAVREFSKSRG
jgi:hypothetical protein